MSTATTAKPKRKLPLWLIVIGIIALICVGLVIALPLLMQAGILPGPPGVRGANNTAEIQTGEVIAITAVTQVESSGAVEAEQIGSVFWETTGQIATVAVEPGDFVKEGDVLMTLDPATVPQNVVQAQIDLLNAQTALEDLLEPATALALANAEKAVSDAQTTLKNAQDDLDDLIQYDLSYYEDLVADKQQALLVAQQDAEKTNIGNLATALQNAQDDLETKTNWYNDAKTAQAQCPECTTIFVNSAGRRMEWAEVEEAYTAALNAYQIAQINYEQSLTSSQDAVENAQEALADAVANLADAKLGPEADELATKQVAVLVAEATLADAQKKLTDLQNGPDPDDVTAAEIRIQIAQNTLDTLNLRAPFDGEVLAVNYLPGDQTSQSQAAVVIANRAQVHVEALIDESDVAQIQVGDAVTMTFDSLPDLTLTGAVDWIDPVGQTVQGLVKYTLRINAQQTDPRVLLGMTANVAIVTDIQAGALAVPLDAVQLDDTGEFVNRVNALGAVERVNVVSGEVQDEFVIITGDLQPGDKVQLVEPTPQTNSSPFG